MLVSARDKLVIHTIIDLLVRLEHWQYSKAFEFKDKKPSEHMKIYQGRQCLLVFFTTTVVAYLNLYPTMSSFSTKVAGVI